MDSSLNIRQAWRIAKVCAIWNRHAIHVAVDSAYVVEATHQIDIDSIVIGGQAADRGGCDYGMPLQQIHWVFIQTFQRLSQESYNHQMLCRY